MVVYAITNMVNEKVYVGQHNGDDLEHYFLHRHIRPSLRGRGIQRSICRAIRKHGYENFHINPLVICRNKSEMDLWEHFFIAAFGSQRPEFGYNLTAGGEGTLGTIPSADTRKRLSLSHQGHPVSELSIQKLVARNRCGPSLETRKRQSEAAKKRFAVASERAKRSASAKRAWARLKNVF